VKEEEPELWEGSGRGSDPPAGESQKPQTSDAPDDDPGSGEAPADAASGEVPADAASGAVPADAGAGESPDAASSGDKPADAGAEDAPDDAASRKVAANAVAGDARAAATDDAPAGTSTADDPRDDARSASAATAEFPYPTRYPVWLRVFLFLFVFDMVGRGILGGIVESNWTKELSITTLPKGIPTVAELERIQRGKGVHATASERFGATLSSVAGFFNPVPSRATSTKIDGVGDWTKYTLTWVRTRLRFIGKLTMINHSWPMFSPNTRRARAVVRSRMYYADGTTLDHYPYNEPRSFTSYSRWFVKRPQKIDERLQTHYNARLGVATYLSHAHPTSEGGAPLEKIEMFKIGYRFPRIGDDIRKHWKRIRARAKEELIYRYDPKTGRGRTVKAPKPKANSK
jgi:hypothetical protein